MDTQPRYWSGPVPHKCDLCSAPIVGTFVDGATVYGPWANMCITCHQSQGRGTGTGRGQQYEQQQDGRWMKIAG